MSAGIGLWKGSLWHCLEGFQIGGRFGRRGPSVLGGDSKANSPTSANLTEIETRPHVESSRLVFELEQSHQLDANCRMHTRLQHI